ncbi:CIC11C00000001932 [Sungouiella intermedia]|uniref:CIC11C00000001932 n=1 Tax=Sungouiella intermedia TaxID=45354 RepID=A0A1L0DRG2_9ASCO|nr:CIC11C00000001932 [[Candida] intermedia]
MAQDVLRFVVIGAGLIGPRHAKSVSKRKDCTLFAIVDRSANGPGVAASCNCLHFKNVDEMLDFCHKFQVDLPDAAIIATPNHTHAEIGMQLAAHGIHLLVEKPMASSAEDCVSLLEFCNQRNVKLLIGHHRRFNPYIITTKANMERIGRPIAIQGVWALQKHQAYFDEKQWRRSVLSGGGALLTNLIHDLDLLLYLISPIERVYAELMPRQRHAEGPDNEVDEGAVLTIKFANGCCGTFLCSDNVTSPFSFEAGTGENPLVPHHESTAGFYRVFGSKGTISVPDMTLYHQHSLPDGQGSWWRPIEVEHIKMTHGASSYEAPNDSMLTPSSSFDPKVPCSNSSLSNGNVNGQPEPFDLQLDHFVNLIFGREKEVKCSGLDAVRALLCIEAVVKSIKTGMPQTVELVSNVKPNSELSARFS